MSFEDTFDRIALALEKIAEALQPQVVTSTTTDTLQIAAATGQVGTPETVGTPPAARKPRGRPAKITADEKASATHGVILEEKPATTVQPAGAQPVDDFLSSAPQAAKPPTLEDLRAALQEYAKKVDASVPGTGMAKARELLGKHGNGASRLAVAKDVPGGDQGVIAPEHYAAVIAAAKV